MGTRDACAHPRVEFRIPISPNERFLRMLGFLIESVRAFGGEIAGEARFVVSVSPEAPASDLEEQLQRIFGVAHDQVEFRWVDPELFARWGYDGTGYDRYLVESDADLVVMADCDLLVIGDLDRVLLDSYHRQIHLGCIAHVSPFDRPETSSASSEEWWQRVFSSAGLTAPLSTHQHTGWEMMSGDPRHRLCPDYYNYGFLISPRVQVETMGSTFLADLEAVNLVHENWARSQIAKTISLARHHIPTDVLPEKYNFPLHVAGEAFRKLNPDSDGEDSVETTRVFHYLGEGEIRREEFSSEETVAALLDRAGLSPEGRLFQSKLRVLNDALARRAAARAGRVG